MPGKPDHGDARRSGHRRGDHRRRAGGHCGSNEHRQLFQLPYGAFYGLYADKKGLLAIQQHARRHRSERADV